MSINLKRIAGAALLVAAIAGSWGVNAAKKSHDSAVARNLNVFNALVKELEMNYVDTIRTDESFSTAIRALLSTVDPYTEYYSSDDAENLAKMTTGEYGGIGSYILQRDSFVYISGPYEGSPAALAGLKAGDRIVRIDTADAKGMASDKVSKLLRGPAGTIVNLRLERPYAGPDSVIEVAVERRKIQTPSVPYSRLDPETGIGYIRLTTFIDKSPKEVETALDSFRNDPRLKGVVLDLRGNGGGLVESAVDIVGFFVPKGTEILRMRGRDKSAEKVYKTSRKPIMPDIPLAVLIDGGSASSSEITAGSLQDLDRAVLIGSRSFGKGLVQGTRPLPYDGFLKVTTGKYYIPSGRLIQALDYSHRNPDGSVARVPDSLTNVYRTAAGREVRDGGGLTPDITVDWGKMSRLLFNIARDNWAFDFATRFAAENPSIPAPEEFEITDGIYADFKASIDPKRFKYDKVGEDLIKQLNETLDAEGYMNDSVRSQLDGLSRLLIHDLDSDLDIKRKDIAEYLGEEIASRYYYERGRAAQQLKGDTAMAEARRILLDPAEYRRILKK
jgi:carboxyl-terminal processing protease